MSANWDAAGVTNRLILGILAGEERKPLLDAFRAQVLREAIAAVEDPEQRRLTSVGSGLGYESALEVLRRLADTAASGSTAGDEQPEVHRLRDELAAVKDGLDHLERYTLPELRREVEWHQAGKRRWRDRAEKAEVERDEHRAAAEAAEAKLRKIEHGCETPESHNYGCPCETEGGAR
ncbi:hypothetical protein [Streptomyces sp. NPDC015131]|uniref:hypothetical protein n=1 Tax=Streptomyces sp. NPDC015131 TaxID=3364941 RepID=UPI0036FB7C4C